MGNKILYVIVYAWAKIHALLPMRILYILSDILYFLIYYVIGYRIKVVRKNLSDSFPEKTDIELRRLERRFYHHFADYIVETIKLAHISLSELQQRGFIVNPEVLNDLLDKGHSCCMLLMGHYGNWEWLSGSTTRLKDCRMYQIYRPLNNQAIYKLFIYLRTKFGSFGIKKNDTLRDIIALKREGIRSLVIFLADQTPSPSNLHYWTTWLNQDTPMLTGPERIARKLNIPVIYLDVRQLRRGYYDATLQIISENPKDTPEFWITEQYARMMERSILRDPAYYLWTHKRWKHKKRHICS